MVHQTSPFSAVERRPSTHPGCSTRCSNHRCSCCFPTSYQLCEYVTASHNDFLSHSSAQNIFINGSFISIPHGSKVTLVQQRQGWAPPSIFINVTSQWPVTSLLLIAFSIVPFAETPTMWVSSIFGNEGGLAHSTWDLVWLHGAVGSLCTITLEDEAAFTPENTCRKC